MTPLKAPLIACAVLLALAGPAYAQGRPIAVKVVVVAMFEQGADTGDAPGELQYWVERDGLDRVYPLPAGYHPARMNDAGEMAVLTGQGTAHAAASIMALGLDPRFDLTHAYWIVAGIAGGSPDRVSLGSAAWARWVVDGDLAQELDARDMPADWPVGIVPYERTAPFQAPAPAIHTDAANVAYRLNEGLVNWAYAKTRDIPLPDDPTLQRLRAPYAGPGARPPFVLEADGLMSARNWYGQRLNDWAERWTRYWTGGQGVFAMSAEEDTGILQALTQLAQAHRADLRRVLILRAASDYTLNPQGVSAADFLARETKAGFPAEAEALDDLYAVGAPVARALADDWAHTRGTVPSAPPNP